MSANTHFAGQTARLNSFTAIRVDGYALLGALLRQPPSPEMKRLLSEMQWNEDLDDDLEEALTILKEGVVRISAEEMEMEYFKLFIGLGRGILIPYGSWYLEEMIQSGPLAAIRFDLNRLGLVRQAGSYESEDHAGALCETMALLITSDDDEGSRKQAEFFKSHLYSWLPRFFTDLAAAKEWDFYQMVGIFGRVFMEKESAYFKSAFPEFSGVSHSQSTQAAKTIEEFHNHDQQRRQ